MRKLTLKLFPKSSKPHQYLSRKSHVYHRLTYDLCGITLKHKQFKESVRYTCCSYQWLYLVFVQMRSPKHKKVPVVCHITNQTGLARLKSSSVKALWVSSRIISLMCNTPFSQPAMQQNVALQVAAKVEQSSTFPNVVRQVAACTISSATCNIIVLESANQSTSMGVVTTEILIIQLVRCKLQKKIV